MTDHPKTKSAPKTGNLLVLANRFFLSLMIAIALIIILSGYFWVVKDGYGRLVASRKSQLEQLIQLRDVLQTQKGYLQDSDNSALEFTASEERLIGLALPDKFDLASALIQLQGLAKSSGFVISAVSAEEAKPIAVKNVLAEQTAVKTNLANDQVKRINLKLELAGSGYDSFKKLVSDLESSVMFFDVEAIEFSKGDSAFQLNLATYQYLKS